MLRVDKDKSPQSPVAPSPLMPQMQAWLHPVHMMHRKCKNPPHRPESSVRS